MEQRVIDSVGLLSPNEEENIFKMIRDLEKGVGSQIAVVIINSLHGQEINQYSLKRFEDLSLGRDLYKDGLLITVAHKERKVRIEVSYGLEGIIKDEIASRIIRNQMVPKFKEQKFYEALFDAVATIKKLIEAKKELVGQKP